MRKAAEEGQRLAHIRKDKMIKVISEIISIEFIRNNESTYYDEQGTYYFATYDIQPTNYNLITTDDPIQLVQSVNNNLFKNDKQMIDLLVRRKLCLYIFSYLQKNGINTDIILEQLFNPRTLFSTFSILYIKENVVYLRLTYYNSIPLFFLRRQTYRDRILTKLSNGIKIMSLHETCTTNERFLQYVSYSQACMYSKTTTHLIRRPQIFLFHPDINKQIHKYQFNYTQTRLLDTIYHSYLKISDARFDPIYEYTGPSYNVINTFLEYYTYNILILIPIFLSDLNYKIYPMLIIEMMDKQFELNSDNYDTLKPLYYTLFDKNSLNNRPSHMYPQIYVFRLHTSKSLSFLEQTETLFFPTFMSTTLNKKYVQNYFLNPNTLIFKIRISSLLLKHSIIIGGQSINPDENELLIQRNSVFQIIETTSVNVVINNNKSITLRCLTLEFMGCISNDMTYTNKSYMEGLWNQTIPTLHPILQDFKFFKSTDIRLYSNPRLPQYIINEAMIIEFFEMICSMYKNSVSTKNYVISPFKHPEPPLSYGDRNITYTPILKELISDKSKLSIPKEKIKESNNFKDLKIEKEFEKEFEEEFKDFEIEEKFKYSSTLAVNLSKISEIVVCAEIGHPIKLNDYIIKTQSNEQLIDSIEKLFFNRETYKQIIYHESKLKKELCKLYNTVIIERYKRKFPHEI